MEERIVDENGGTTIAESEMLFGAFPNNYFDALFDIEESKIYKGSSDNKGMKSNGVKSTEFLLRKRDKNHIWIVEAKASSPNKLNCVNRKKDLVEYIKEEDKSYQSREKQPFLIELYTKVKHDTYYDDIKLKFNDILALIASISLAQHSNNSELPELFHFSKNNKFYLVLVVKNENKKDDKKWLQDLQSLVEIKLKSLITLWNLSPTSVKVMNEQGAKKYGLINNNLL
jgi:hypothetical protein